MTQVKTEKVALGKRLAEARMAAGLSQPTVVLLLGSAGQSLTKQAVSAWEHGRNVPDAVVLKALAQLYDTSADSLLGLQPHSAEAEHLAAVFDSLDADKRASFIEICGPFLQKHARGIEADLFAPQEEDPLSAADQRLADANRRDMLRRSTANRHKRTA